MAGLRGNKGGLERSRDTDTTAAALNNSSLELPDLEEGESAYGSESGRASLMSTLER